jgi:hypothetical protein
MNICSTIEGLNPNEELQALELLLLVFAKLNFNPDV